MELLHEDVKCPLDKVHIREEIALPPAMFDHRVEDYLRYRVQVQFVDKCFREGFIFNVEQIDPIGGHAVCKASPGGEASMLCPVSFEVRMYRPAKGQELCVCVSSKESRLNLCIAQHRRPHLLVSITNRLESSAFASIQVQDWVWVRVDDYRVMQDHQPIRMVATFLRRA
jgi:DNA-directed RNA polymerase subunit E'/Rpb7